jgi:hypothetical protein
MDSSMSPLPPLPPIFFLTAPVAQAAAITDRGRSVPVFRYETALLPLRGQSESYASEESKRLLLSRAEQEYFANMNHDLDRLVRVGQPAPRANCHGWVFTGGAYGILDEFVEPIIADNGYQPIESPRPGDLVVYRRHGIIMHSGSVQTIAGGVAVIESKWGPFGVFLHPADCHPYDDLAFFRSPRRGHGVIITCGQ